MGSVRLGRSPADMGPSPVGEKGPDGPDSIPEDRTKAKTSRTKAETSRTKVKTGRTSCRVGPAVAPCRSCRFVVGPLSVRRRIVVDSLSVCCRFAFGRVSGAKRKQGWRLQGIQYVKNQILQSVCVHLKVGQLTDLLGLGSEGNHNRRK